MPEKKHIEYPIGFNIQSQKLINISDVINENKKDIICLDCNESFIAVRNHQTPHFKHKPNTKCEGNFETYIHWVTKEVFKEIKEIEIPEIEIKNLTSKQKEQLENKINNLIKSNLPLNRHSELKANLKQQMSESRVFQIEKLSIDAKKDAYLPYLELGAYFNSVTKIMRMGVSGFKLENQLSKFKKEPLLEKQGKIADTLKKNQSVIVQISKEPISNKGAKVTTDLSFAGRFLVLLPFSSKVNISKKIGNPETKKRLRDLVKEIKPTNFGMIIRTVAEDANDDDLRADLKELLRKWDTFYTNLKSAEPVRKLLSEDNRLRSLLRDMINESYSQIVCNDKPIFDDIKSYFNAVDPSKENLIKAVSKVISPFRT